MSYLKSVLQGALIGLTLVSPAVFIYVGYQLHNGSHCMPLQWLAALYSVKTCGTEQGWQAGESCPAANSVAELIDSKPCSGSHHDRGYYSSGHAVGAYDDSYTNSAIKPAYDPSYFGSGLKYDVGYDYSWDKEAK